MDQIIAICYDAAGSGVRCWSKWNCSRYGNLEDLLRAAPPDVRIVEETTGN